MSRGAANAPFDANDLLRRALDAGALQALYDGITDTVLFVKNAQGRYVLVNQTLVERCGKRFKRELLGCAPHELFPDDLAWAFAQQDRQVLEHGRAIRDRLEVHLYPDRSRGWCVTQKLPLHDATGRCIGLIGISKDIGEPDRPGADLREVAAAAEYLQEHYADTVRIEDVAALSGLSLARLQRLFKRAFQVPPLQLLIRERLRVAGQLLNDTDASITEIAHYCGYAEHSSFTRQFRAHVGEPPQAFRRTARASTGGARSGPAALPSTTRRVLRVLVAEGVDDTLFRIAGGPHPGFDREILEGFARLHDLRLVTVAQPRWSDLLPALMAGEGDVIAGGYSVTPSRRQQIAFSSEALPTRIVALSYRPHPVVTTLDALRGATIGVARDSSMQEEALRLGIPPRRLKEEPGYCEVDLRALRAREVTVILADLHSALLSSHSDRRVQMGLFLGARGSLAFGFRPGEADLRAALDGYLAHLRKRGHWRRLVMSYWDRSGVTLLDSV